MDAIQQFLSQKRFAVVGAGASSGFVRTGDYSGGGDVTGTAMVDLGAGRASAAAAK